MRTTRRAFTKAAGAMIARQAPDTLARRFGAGGHAIGSACGPSRHLPDQEWDGHHGRPERGVLPRADILIRNGVIERIGRGLSVPVRS